MKKSKDKAILIDIGKTVRRLRLEKSWSQEELAHQSGFHRTYVGMLERGERNIAVLNLCILCNSLEISLSDFFIQVKNGED